MINISTAIVEKDNEETETQSMSETIERIINGPIERKKNIVRKDIKLLISKKIEEIEKTKRKKFKKIIGK